MKWRWGGSLAVFLLFLGAAAAVGSILWRKESARRQGLESARPLTRLAEQLNGVEPRGFCDGQIAHARGYAAAVVDRFRPEIRALWAKRKATEEPSFALLSLGRIQLKVSPKVTPPPHAFDSTAWSWGEAYGIIQRTQQDPGAPENEDRWRDLDSVVRYLLEKDFLRLRRHVDFAEPESARHRFRPNPAVARSGPREFTVPLDAGDFRGYEKVLQAIFESEWQGRGYRVRIRWVAPGAGAYALRVLLGGNRCFVNHDKMVMQIVNLAWTKTLAHELGHVLGFDDHYYDVWHDRYCYYTQESRLGDLMSNSDKGSVTARHWELLDQAYPWRKPGPRGEFVYAYGKY